MASSLDPQSPTAEMVEEHKSAGTIDPSSSNNRGDSKRLIFRNVFCGREAEILKLEGIFRRTVSGRVAARYPSMVLVGGASGTGKSTLVSKLRDHLHTTEEEFFWISGKFEDGQQQQQSAESDDSSKQETTDSLHPFAAIVDAFSNFCQELNDEEPETLEEVKADILEAVGQQGALLTNMIPSLTEIIGVQPETGIETQQSDIQRFHVVFRQFLQALASQVRSVVLVLDDVHRADTPSLDLLHSLLTSPLKHVVFIGTYRSSEVDDKHRFTKWINSVDKAQSEQQGKTENPSASSNNNDANSYITKLELLGLDLETINSLISRVLNVPTNATRSLAHIVFTKTQGNTFFATQYLLNLNRINLLWFDAAKNSWDWDEEAIRKEASITTTLLDFMKDKMAQSEVAPKVLPVAGCLGARFNREILGMILTGLDKVEALRNVTATPTSDEQLVDMLKVCEKEGFIQNCGNKYYCFLHDKMQEAALNMHPAVTMQQIRCEAGTVLFQQLDERQLDEMIFVVLNLLNVSQFMNGTVSPLEIVQLNLKAAVKAKRLAAFSSASTYVEIANRFFPLHMLDASANASPRAIFLEMNSLGAEVEGALARMNRVEKYCNAILNSTQEYTIFEQLRVQTVLMDCIANTGGQVDFALEKCIGLLEELGCSLPKSSIGQGFRTVTSLLQSKAVKNIPRLEDVDEMGEMTELSKLEGMRLLYRASIFAYLEANQSIFTLVTTRMVRWTIRYGISESSPMAFALLGLVLMHAMGDYNAGSLYGELAASLIRKLQKLATDESKRSALTQSHSRTSFLAYGLILYWIKPVGDYQDEMVAGYEAGMRAGDTESAFWNTFHDLGIRLHAGKDLKGLEQLCRKGVTEMVAFQKEEAEVYTRLIWQSVLNLSKYSATEGTTDLSGSAMHENDVAEQEGPWASKLVPSCYGVMKVYLCAYFGDYEQGARIAIEDGDRFLVEAPGSTIGQFNPFLRGVCLYAAANDTKKRIYRGHAKKVRATVRSWVDKGNSNAVHQLKLLDAEHEACFGKRRETTNALYEEACNSAFADGFIQDAALANERFAYFLLASPMETDVEDGKKRLAKCVSFYEEWGARAKVEALLAKFPDLKLPVATPKTSRPRSFKGD